jgi:hypothetical protein
MFDFTRIHFRRLDPPYKEVNAGEVSGCAGHPVAGFVVLRFEVASPVFSRRPAPVCLHSLALGKQRLGPAIPDRPGRFMHDVARFVFLLPIG